MPDSEMLACEYCQEEFLSGDMVGSFCQGCAYSCSDCDYRTDSTDDFDAFDRCEDCSLLCVSCGDCCESRDPWNRGRDCCTTNCGECGDDFLPMDQEIHCENCSSFSSVIEDWDYVPHLKYFHTTLSPMSRQPLSGLYMGVEVEMECTKETPEDVAIELSFTPSEPWYIKSDGSLDNGIEVVSHPIDIERWRTCMDMEWMPGARDLGCRSYGDTCGLHIHISRSQFTKLHLWKILTLLAQNYAWTKHISRRKIISTFASQDKLEDFIDASYIVDKAINKVNGVRYTAVNMANSETIEFRLFRGTLSRKGLLRNIDWLACLVGYTRTVSIPELSLDSFHAWIRSSESERYISRISAEVIANWSEEKIRCA